jgi:type II secretory pathway component GspD/PulD (secretin)
MSIIGFSLRKVTVERKNSPKGKVSINTNFGIKEVVKADVSLGSDKSQGVQIKFHYDTEFAPDIGSIHFEGDVLSVYPQKEAEEIITQFKETKKVSPKLAQPILNHIFQKCSVEALIMAKTLNLPSPIKIPRVQSKQE